MAKVNSIDDYIASFPEDVQAILTEIRRRIHELVPDGEETIRYEIPTIQVGGRSLVHFAGWKHHVSLYPKPDADGELAAALAPYDAGKGTLKFPLSEPIPYDLIDRAVAALVAQRAPAP